MLEEKLDTLTKEIVALRQTIEANGGAAAPAAAKKTTATKKKEEPVEPEHDADEVGAVMRKAAKKDKPAVLKHIKSTKSADLADMLTKPETYDAAFEFAQGILDAPDDEDDDV